MTFNYNLLSYIKCDWNISNNKGIIQTQLFTSANIICCTDTTQLLRKYGIEVFRVKVVNKAELAGEIGYQVFYNFILYINKKRFYITWEKR